MLAAGPPTRFTLDPERSAVVVEARSNVGPIMFATAGLTGVVEATVDDDGVDASTASARLELPVCQLASGNKVYDSELFRRIDARRYPQSTAELRTAQPIDASGRFHVAGDIVFHGVKRRLTGEVTVASPSRNRLVVTGEEHLDIREFDLAPPTMLMVKIEPEVRIRLHVEAQAGP